jgi:hypothetical protein
MSVAPSFDPPGGARWLSVSADGRWFWDGAGWQPTQHNPWPQAAASAPAPAAWAPTPLVSADGMWWWTGYGWAPTLAALAFHESERRRRLQSWLNIGAAAFLFLR